MSIRIVASIGLVSGLILQPLPARAAEPSPAATHDQWNAPQEPFRIHGNTWYVGPHGLSSILVDTGDGLVLLDGGLPASAPAIEAHVRALGFRMRDVRWILNSHAHADHAGGLAALQRDSGAQVLASAAGARALALGGVDPDDPQHGTAPAFSAVGHVRPVGDGETLKLGGLAITAHYTPGHTPGSTTWTWSSCDEGRCLHVVYADSLTALGGPHFRFGDHPRRVEAFRQSIATVAALPCDILLTPHPDASGFWEKVARRTQTDSAPLVDTGACRKYAASATRKLDATLREERGAK